MAKSDSNNTKATTILFKVVTSSQVVAPGFDLLFPADEQYTPNLLPREAGASRIPSSTVVREHNVRTQASRTADSVEIDLARFPSIPPKAERRISPITKARHEPCKPRLTSKPAAPGCPKICKL